MDGDHHLHRGQLLQRYVRLHAGPVLPGRGGEEGLRALRVRAGLRDLRAHSVHRQSHHRGQSEPVGHEGDILFLS